MKKYLQFIEERELSTLLEKVDDFYEYKTKSTDKSKQLQSKILKMKSLSEKSNIRLDEFFKEKLIFKLFNECNWEDDKLLNKTNTKSISETIKKLADEHGINLSKEEK